MFLIAQRKDLFLLKEKRKTEINPESSLVSSTECKIFFRKLISRGGIQIRQGHCIINWDTQALIYKNEDSYLHRNKSIHANVYRCPIPKITVRVVS